MTLIELIQRGSLQLEAAGLSYGHGTTNAFDEMVWLALWRLGHPLDDLDSVASQVLSEAQVAQIESLVQQRIATRKPAAYLTQQAWLQGLAFYVDERAIVPRSLIAELIAHPDYADALDSFLSDQTTRALDLCTGNGSLAILLATAFPDLQVDASDISTDALAVADINVAQHHLQERIRLFQANGLEPQQHGVYDLIVCNPPYVNAQSMAALPPEYRAEPALALDGNAAGNHDGMDFIRPLLAQAAQHLSPKGVLVLEIGHEIVHFEAAFPGLPAIWLETSAGSEQVLLLTRTALIHHWPTV
jgi:ribosomal protein L3 glutamine methyltransferase